MPAEIILLPLLIILIHFIPTLTPVTADTIPHVNGYVRLVFTPPNLVSSRGERVIGNVNISIEEDSQPQDLLMLQSCCVDTEIAELIEPVFHRVVNYSAFNVQLEGKRLGRSSVQFWITRNMVEAASTNPLERNNSNWWWVAYSYDVIVKEEDTTRLIGNYLSAVVLGLFALNLVGVGGQVEGEEVINLVKRPLAVTTGMVCRFGILPAVALGLVEVLQPEQDTSLGVLALLCSPAEGASNLLVLLAESDLTFSATLTTLNNFASIGMLPLWAILFETRIYTSAGNIRIPFKECFTVFGVMLISLILGFILHRKCSNCYHTVWTYLPSFTIGTLIIAVIVEIYANNFIFPLISKEIMCVCTLIAISGYFFGAGVAFIAQQPKSRILVLSVETGTRTTFITGLLLQQSLPQPEGDMAKTAPVLCVLISLIPASIAIISLRTYKRFRFSKEYPEMEVDIPDVEDIEDGEDSLPDKDRPEVVGEKETCM